ncbi:MAG TPA: hypothetical protein VFH01_06220 [Pyrinomonadaceae bacterium]|nr:hypothetical protein [Pyrinomonadaceae bacterium]
MKALTYLTQRRVRLRRRMCGGGYAPPFSSLYDRAVPLVRALPLG